MPGHTAIESALDEVAETQIDGSARKGWLSVSLPFTCSLVQVPETGGDLWSYLKALLQHVEKLRPNWDMLFVMFLCSCCELLAHTWSWDYKLLQAVGIHLKLRFSMKVFGQCCMPEWRIGIEENLKSPIFWVWVASLLLPDFGCGGNKSLPKGPQNAGICTCLHNLLQQGKNAEVLSGCQPHKGYALWKTWFTPHS